MGQFFKFTTRFLLVKMLIALGIPEFFQNNQKNQKSQRILCKIFHPYWQRQLEVSVAGFSSISFLISYFFCVLFLLAFCALKINEIHMFLI